MMPGTMPTGMRNRMRNKMPPHGPSFRAGGQEATVLDPNSKWQIPAGCSGPENKVPDIWIVNMHSRTLPGIYSFL